MAVSLEKQIGDGGFADVWRGVDDLDRPVAVKIIRPASLGVADSLAHAKALARAHHRNVVTVFRVDRVLDPTTNNECDCVVMELLEGETLAKVVAGPTELSQAEAVRIGTGIIDGLAHIHSQGLVHGDLHDENVMVTTDEVKIIDILYRDSLALFSSASQDFKIRRDVSDLKTLITGILDSSEYGHSSTNEFLQRLSSRPTIADVRESFRQVLGESSAIQRASEVAAVIEHEFVDPAIYFYNERFTQAFPGVRGIVRFHEPNEIVERLKILLRNPLGFRGTGKDERHAGLQNPIWWWRGLGNLQIESFEHVSGRDILINVDEWRVRKAAAHNSASYYQCFVYLEFDPMEPTGLYDYEEGYIEEWTEKLGGVHEEYGLFEGRRITRAEYDDGAAVIGGKVVDTMGRTKLRSRYITPYNLVIASQKSPINNIKFDRDFDRIMRGILDGSSSIECLAEAVCALPRKSMYRD